jgi:hypothetical protein
MTWTLLLDYPPRIIREALKEMDEDFDDRPDDWGKEDEDDEEETPDE